MTTRLKLDLDARRVPLGLPDRVVFVCRMLKTRVFGMSYRRSRRGWHIEIVTGRALPPLAIVAVQAILGSDPMRELFNLVRARRLRHVAPMWRQRWNVLYDVKYRRAV